uniref:Uncharacterized protein n=1 Tax=Gopherus agassizii TaxID=38772 RepID=A0A452J2U9_9SAUR
MAAGARGAGPGVAVTALLAAWLVLALGPAAASRPSQVGSPGEQRGRVQVLSAANWSLVLQGQWMVQFVLPFYCSMKNIMSH